MGIAALLVAIVFSRVRLPEIPHGEFTRSANAIPHTRRSSLSALFHNRYFLFGLFALFSYEIAEISINSFFINYVTDEGWMSARDASVALSFGGLGLFMLGRVSGSFVMQHIAGETVLRVCAVGTFVTTFLVVLDLGMVSLCALVLIYVFESIMFPTIFALSLQGLGPLTKRASSLLMMTPHRGCHRSLPHGHSGRLCRYVGSIYRSFGGFCQRGCLCFFRRSAILTLSKPLPVFLK